MRAPAILSSGLIAACLLVLGAAPASARDTDTPAIKARAITLTPHITELVYAAGAGDRIVATVTASDYPPEALRIPRIGNGIQIDVEKAVAVQPDVVIAWLPTGAAQTMRPMMDRLHVPVIHSRPEALLDIPSEIERFGKLFGTEGVANTKAKELRDRIHRLADRHAARPTVSVFVEVGGAPLYTIGNDRLLTDVLATCGAVNVYADTRVAAPQIAPESVLVRSPDAVLLPGDSESDTAATLTKWQQLRLPAALQGHVFALDPDALFRPGPRLVDAAEQLCAHLEFVRR